MQASTRSSWHRAPLILDPQHPQPRHLPDLLLDALEAKALTLLGAGHPRLTFRYLIVKAYFYVLRRIVQWLFPHPDYSLRPAITPRPAWAPCARLKTPNIDYTEFAQYDTLQKEFKDEAAGSTADLEWKTVFLDLKTEQELLERYIDWTAEEMVDIRYSIVSIAHGFEEREFLEGLQRELVEDMEEVMLEQEVHRSRFGKEEVDEEVLWKRIIRLREETLRDVRGKSGGGEVRSVLRRYEHEMEWREREGGAGAES